MNRTRNPYAGHIESDAQRRELHEENAQLFARREISRAEYEEAYDQINRAYAAMQDRAVRDRR